MDSYDEKVSQLQDELLKDEPDKEKLEKRMLETYTGRQKWFDEGPPVSHVLDLFPPLKTFKHVSIHSYVCYTRSHLVNLL